MHLWCLLFGELAAQKHPQPYKQQIKVGLSSNWDYRAQRDKDRRLRDSWIVEQWVSSAEDRVLPPVSQFRFECLRASKLPACTQQRGGDLKSDFFSKKKMTTTFEDIQIVSMKNVIL